MSRTNWTTIKRPFVHESQFKLLDILQIILPVFVLLGVGYVAVKVGYLSPDIAGSLNAFTVRLAVPTLLFKSMMQLDLSKAYNFPMLISFYAGSISCFAVGILLARFVWKRRLGEAVAIGFCALFSNTVLLGIPIAERAYGGDVMAYVFGIVSLHAPLLYIIGMICMELARRDGKTLAEALGAALKSILANALMVGILLGILVNLNGLSLPEIILVPVNLLAAAAIPIALIGIGASLPKYEINADLKETLTLTTLALFLHPVIAFTLTHWVFGLDANFVKAAVVLAAMPPGMNIYVFAVMYDRAVRLSASVFVIATALSIVTISIWLWILGVVFG